MELFEIDLVVVIDTKGMEHAVTDSVHQWDKLDQDLTSEMFPNLREVNVSIHTTFLHLKEKQQAQVEQQMMESFKCQLARLRSSPQITVNVNLVVRNDWF